MKILSKNFESNKFTFSNNILHLRRFSIKNFNWYGLIAIIFGSDILVKGQDPSLYYQEHKIFENGLSESAVNQCPQAWQFMCADGTECIAQYDVCDGIAQCSDHSDEKNCHNSYVNQQPIAISHIAQPVKSQHPRQFTSTEKSSLATKSVEKLKKVEEKRLPMEYLLTVLIIFVILAGIIHTILKNRRLKRLTAGGGLRRGFRKGESLVEDEDDLLISQMYT